MREGEFDPRMLWTQQEALINWDTRLLASICNLLSNYFIYNKVEQIVTF